MPSTAYSSSGIVKLSRTSFGFFAFAARGAPDAAAPACATAAGAAAFFADAADAGLRAATRLAGEAAACRPAFLSGSRPAGAGFAALVVVFAFAGVFDVAIMPPFFI
ncbi:MAG: hypothetical protein ACTHL1_07760 [Burkholderiaceae bacterium]